MSYLAELSLRLAAGVERLPEELREQTADYVIGAQQPDGGFAGREGGSDLYYTSFALRGLALLGQLSGPTAQRAADFLAGQLQTRVAIVDFLSLVYGAALVEASAGIDVFAQAPAGWREAVARELERYRRPDGGYAKTDEGASSSTYYSFLMVLCQQLVGSPIVEPQRLVAFLASRRRPDGGFVEMGPMQRSGTNPTAAALGLWKVLGGADEATRESAIEFLLDAQTDEGGFRANTRILLADVLSTFTGLLTLGDLGALDEVDLPAARSYVESQLLPSGGFRGGEWDEAADVEYTFYGLGALALLAAPTHARERAAD